MHYCMENKITIRNSTQLDFDWIKKLWYANRDTLSIPFKRCIDELCTDKNCYVVEIDNVPIAIGRIHFVKTKYEIRIEHLVVDEVFRGKGIGTLLLKYLVSTFTSYEQGLIDPDIVAYAVVGADNNAFYSKFEVSKTVVHRKTKDLYRYILDKEKLV